MKLNGSAALTSFFYKKNANNLPNWKLQFLVKCSSTEHELNNYLIQHELIRDQPVAIFSGIQTHSFGRYGRKWISHHGGIWMSAVYPIFTKEFSTEIFSISIASKLCEMLLRESINANIKWPNDIFYGSKKLIGFLPKVITRGDEIKYVRIGIGFNLNNIVPKEGISLSQILMRKNLCINNWSSKILQVICNAIKSNSDKRRIIQTANEFLNKDYLPIKYRDDGWNIKDIDSNGNLRIYKNNYLKILSL